MANKKLNDLDTTVDFNYAYVELDSNQYKITKENLGKQLTQQVHLEFNTITSNPDYIFVQDASNYRKISLHDLAKAIRNDIPSLSGDLPGNKMIYDGCFIMYHARKTYNKDGWPRAVTYAQWPEKRDAGEVADGVLIVDGGHYLLVAPHEKQCRWASKIGAGGPDNESYTTANRIKFLNTWDGKERTERICGPGSPFENENKDSSTYAPGYCYNYTPHPEIDSSTPGLKAHDYWLPCIAELMMIYTHKDKINAGLKLIPFSHPLQNTDYWTSNNDAKSYAWYINLNNGYLKGAMNKMISNPYARPVSTFTQNPKKT